MSESARRVTEQAAPQCGNVNCQQDGAVKQRGTWYCEDHMIPREP